MPEGPEIRRTADQLAGVMVGTPLTLAWFGFPELKRHGSRLRGRCIIAIESRGKALLTHFEQGETLYSHNQLYGVWKIAEPGQRPETRRALRVALESAHCAILLYSASDISMWKTKALGAHPFLSRLGPDVLDPALTAGHVELRLRDSRFSGRQLSTLLLDQGFLAGMGNYLRCEVLFEAGIAAGRRPATLSDDERAGLAQALLAVPARSYRSAGITPSGGMRRDYIADSATGFRFQVFSREGSPCRACGIQIARTQSGGRRLYACPRCQV